MTTADDGTPLRLDAEHPWPGLAAYDEAAQAFFHGREDETAELRRRIELAPLAVLYGRSGLGKSSLLQAGLFPRLREGPYFPVYVRINFGMGAEQAPDEQIAARLAAEAAHHGVELPERAAGEPLWEWLHRPGFRLWSPDNRPLVPVFALDQFEEVFTRTADHRARRAAHLATLGNLIENRVPPALAGDRARRAALDLLAQPWRVLLSFREDFLPDFDGWKDQLPSLLRNRYRLLPMRRAQAVRAVAEAGARVLEPGVAPAIVDFVARGGGQAGGDGVEPVLLSLCCERLNRLRRPGRRVDAELLREAGDDILNDFYAEALQGLEPRVAQFIEAQLVQGDRYRGTYPRDDVLARGWLTAAELARLTDRYRLLRIEQQTDVARIELIHDRLVPVVVKARDRRLAAEREQAERAGREAAEREAAEQAARRAEAEAARQRMRLMRNAAVVALVSAIGLAGLAGYAQFRAAEARDDALLTRSELQRSFEAQAKLLAATRDAERAASAAAGSERLAREEVVHLGRVSRARELIAHSLQQAPLDTELSVMLAAEALKTEALPEAVERLKQALSEWRQERRVDVGGALVQMVPLADGRFLVAARDGMLKVVTLASGGVATLGTLQAEPSGLAVVDGGRIVVAWGTEGTTPVTGAWDPGSGKMLWRRPLGGVTASACCARLLATRGDLVQLLDAATGAVVAEQRVDLLYAAGFVSGGKSFLTAGHWRDPTQPALGGCGGSEIRRYDGSDGRFEASMARSGDGDGSWIFDPDGRGAIVASRGPAEHCSGYRDESSWVSWAGGSVLLAGSPGRVKLARFRPGLVALASAAVIQVWRLGPASSTDRPANARIIGSTLHLGDVLALAWFAEGSLLASADATGKLRAWAADYDNPRPPVVFNAATHAAADVAFVSEDRLASVGADGTLRIWNLPNLNPYAQAQPVATCARCATSTDWLTEARRRLPRDFSANERSRFGIETGR